jgi:hypothetical protein
MYRGKFLRDGKRFFLVGTRSELEAFRALAGVSVAVDPYNPEWL